MMAFRPLHARSVRLDKDQLQAPGVIQVVGRRPVHVMQAGPESASSCVVFESALGCPCSEWILVQRQLAEVGIRSVAYDRPGIGWTPAIGTTDDPDEHVAQLSTLLDDSSICQVILVGHSVGGLLVRSFWRRHPEKVAAMVLVDASHPDQHLRSSRQREGLRVLRAQLRAARRRHVSTPVEGEVALLPAPFDQLTHAIATSPNGIRAASDELKEWLASWGRDAARVDDLDDLPLAVLTAGATIAHDPAHQVLQEELLALSSNARQVVYEGASHQGIVMNPEFATDVAAEISAAVRRS
jgi:pimeloyl-ACP methyl ester carboxylesterase